MNSITKEKWPNWVTLLDTLLRLNSILAKKQNGWLIVS